MTHRDRFTQIHNRLEPLRQDLLTHPIYHDIDRLPKLRVFMQHHIFAVWDFMSLLKSLQQQLCPADVPWLPPKNRLAARLVNEIVLGEETDEDGHGGFASHYDLYHRAMTGCGASTGQIDGFLAELARTGDYAAALDHTNVADSVRQFVEGTFSIIEQNDVCAIASAFTFGREDLLPDVFQRIVDELSVESSAGLEDFRFYLSRHIELDGDHHGPMAARMMESLCGESEAHWQAADSAAVRSLELRKILWDGMHNEIKQLDTNPSPVAG